jgi:hypothetical protein
MAGDVPIQGIAGWEGQRRHEGAEAVVHHTLGDVKHLMPSLVMPTVA